MLPIRSISVAAPAYNEGEGIGAIVEHWAAFLDAHFAPDTYEIVVCNDGSQDDTAAALEAVAQRYRGIKVCSHAVNQGAAASVATAIRHTSKDWVLLLDADGQFPIENLGRFRDALVESPVPALIGFRPKKEDSIFARAGSWASGWVCNLAHGTRYRDFNCALKLVEGRLLRDLCLEAKGLNYSTELSSKILERGVEMREVPILHQPRRRGRSSRSLVKGSVHRFLFVAYVLLRQFLFRFHILHRRSYLR